MDIRTKRLMKLAGWLVLLAGVFLGWHVTHVKA